MRARVATLTTSRRGPISAGQGSKTPRLLAAWFPALFTRGLEPLALALDPRAAPSKGAVTGLSCPTISGGCPLEYRFVQASPPKLAAVSRGAVSPTCAAQVRPSRAAPGTDWSPSLLLDRVGRVATAPVSSSPNLASHGSKNGGLGRTGHHSPERPLQPDEPHYGHPATARAWTGVAPRSCPRVIKPRTCPPKGAVATDEWDDRVNRRTSRSSSFLWGEVLRGGALARRRGMVLGWGTRPGALASTGPRAVGTRGHIGRASSPASRVAGDRPVLGAPSRGVVLRSRLPGPRPWHPRDG